ncbi:MAG: peptide chain release factor N(5)-glutamine methyltransferase [Deltaproteobacteria bacterium]|nr:peptide chain release factor N(5)-glutamine methyltransferase [Deltaproteobacteria bacterium]
MKNQIDGDKKIWTILEIINWTTSYFKSLEIETSRMDAEILLAYVLNIKRIDLYLNYDKPLLANELNSFKTLIIRRKEKEPIAYIIGAKEFWSMEFTVTKDVLIPRPDTEILVEAAVAAIKKIKDKGKLKILELGVGSGAVISTIAFSAPDNIFFGTDICKKALNIAKQNGKKHNLKINFFLSDWFSAFKEKKVKFDIIISNPPYIPTEDIQGLAPEIKLYEPVSALDGGGNGLDSVNKIISDARFYLNKNGLLLLEIGFDQKKRVFDMVNSKEEYENPVCLKDYGGNNRVVIVKKIHRYKDTE